MWSLPTARRAIVVAGCLGMAFTQLTTCPAAVEFARSLGANGLHVGLIGAMPTAMLFMQFMAGYVANHLSHRRRTWFVFSVAQRVCLLPVAFGPLMFPEVSDSTWITLFVLATALNQGLLHFTTPLWLSWMGDYLPQEGLSRFWGVRHWWMQWTGAATLLLGACFLMFSGWSVREAFPLLVLVGSVLGVADLLLFSRVEEPPVRPARGLRLREVFLGPFRESRFRSFIGFTCYWHFAAMVGAPFISVYLLDVVGMDLFQVLALWAWSWVGGATCSRLLGRLAEECGNRPVLVLCTICKPLNMAALLLAPPEPVAAFWILTPVFMFDAALNAGFAIATNGFLLKYSPTENRTMYIAAGTAVAGLVGGITSVAAGGSLMAMGSWSVSALGGVWVGYHVLFAISFVLRVLAVRNARRIHEPGSRSASEVLMLLLGVPADGTEATRPLALPEGAICDEEATIVAAAPVPGAVPPSPLVAPPVPMLACDLAEPREELEVESRAAEARAA